MFFLIFLVGIYVSAAEPVVPAIAQARGLALKKKRQEACALLQKALEGQSNPKVRAQLTESLDHIAKMFFTDKGQKQFESGHASMWENPDLALAQFKAVQAPEDNNVQILNNMARVHLMKQECAPALEALAQARRVNPYLAESAVLELRALACEQNYAGLRERAKNLPALGKWEESYVQYLLAQEALSQKAWRKALDAAIKVSEEQPQFPETYFLLARAGTGLDRDVEPWLQKYVSLCKGVTMRERRQFSLEPKLCANVKEAEDELASKNKEP